MPRKGDYLYKRRGSENWYLRIQFPDWLAKLEGRTKIERSLGTSDRQEAELLAFEDIRDHKYALWMRRQFKKKAITSEPGPKRYEPGKIHHNANGETIVADDTTLKFYDASGSFLRSEENGLTVLISIDASSQDRREIAPYIPKRKRADDDIVSTWIKHRNIGKHLESETYGVWNTFKKLVGNKPLSKCQREDGRNLASFLISTGNSTSTVEKKIGHLRAAVNLAIDEGLLSQNPFQRVVPRSNDQLERCPLSDSDMELIAKNLHNLKEEDQLLLLTLSSTGMRLSEAFQITNESIETGVRYTIVGTKTKSSKRRVPFPSLIIPRLPTTIVKPLFIGEPEVAGKRLRYFLRSLNISFDQKRGTGDRRKVVHSLRHRVKDKLRANECPIDVQYEILGHENRTVASGYGHGSPINRIKSWLDAIDN